MHQDLHKSHFEGYLTEINLIEQEIHDAVSNLDEWVWKQTRPWNKFIIILTLPFFVVGGWRKGVWKQTRPWNKLIIILTLPFFVVGGYKFVQFSLDECCAERSSRSGFGHGSVELQCYADPSRESNLTISWKKTHWIDLSALQPLVGAIAAGNCVVIKPGSYAEHSSNVMAKLVCFSNWQSTYFTPVHKHNQSIFVFY